MKVRIAVLSLLLSVVLLVQWAAGTAPADGVKRLSEGNERYVSGHFANKASSGSDFRRELATGQHPYAVVVACADSRVSPEIIFDQDLGDLFVVRTAGNVVDPVALGSIEYAVEHLHTPLIVVVGHESCGAVKAAVDQKGKPEGNIGAIIKKILPAVEKAKASGHRGPDLLYHSTIENVKNTAGEILKRSKILSHEVGQGKVKIVGAFYSIATGKVEPWF